MILGLNKVKKKIFQRKVKLIVFILTSTNTMAFVVVVLREV